MPAPRVIIGLPLFNHAKDLPEAIESMLGQTFTDFALVLVDDCSTDQTPQIAREYEALDSRVAYSGNEQRLGLIDNSRGAFRDRSGALSRRRVLRLGERSRPLASTLAAGARGRPGSHPEVVLAYPLNRRIGVVGEVLARKPWAFDTFGVTNRWKRMRLSIMKMSAGNMVYGLYRARARPGGRVPPRARARSAAVHGTSAVRAVQAGAAGAVVPAMVQTDLQPRPAAQDLLPCGGRFTCTSVVDQPRAPACSGRSRVRGTGAPRFPARKARSSRCSVSRSRAVPHVAAARALRIDLLERIMGLRPYERRLRLMGREIVRRGIVDWTRAHLKPYVGVKARRRRRASTRGWHLAFESVRRPGPGCCHGLHALPVVSRRDPVAAEGSAR